MKNINAIVVIALGGIFLFNCNSANQENKINIPEGEYALDASRGIFAAVCGMSETTFGKTLNIVGSKIETSPMEGAETKRYEITKVSDTEFRTTVFRPIVGDSMPIEFFLANNELKFSCNGKEIVYQKK